MKTNHLKIAVLVAAILISANLAVFSQKKAVAPKKSTRTAVAPKSLIDEKNVRSAMGFLASDAMQGRGSGSLFERIAAEYIGSQFMQFGLEPAGEPGWDGKPTYVQTVSTNRRAFAGNPTIRIGSITVEHGKEMIVSRASSDKATGSLQKMSITDKPNPNAAVFVKLPEGGNPRAAGQQLQGLINNGASIVIVEETPQYRATWGRAASNKVMYPINNPNAKPSAIVIVDKNTAAAISGMADGTNVEFAGTPGQMQATWNAMGKITGQDKTLAAEVILLTSHLDHIGVNESAPGDDKIFNGADDDASGSVAVLEMARVLGAGTKPKRTVYFVCFGSEEAGGFGASWFVNNLPIAKDKLVANLEFEMIGRPDEKVKPEELWLTGYERSNLGPELAKRGAKLVQDPHPTENFFQRSDNIQLARQGIIAHTVSSFGLHKDYHQASDEVKTIDFSHMTRSIDSMVKPIQWLVNSNFVPAWVEGKKP